MTLELKYMANFIEFQMRARYSRTFFENNSKLQPSGRLLEVEIMSELSKIFGVSMQVGRAIYGQL